ncbi:MAG: ribosome-associated translation inhibitor RaiA [Clostridia bacterium]|nr:ribosome-associated translation inhibitor RaiA [Clostridia bacterium]
MKIELIQKNYVAKEKLTDLINKKVQKFEKYLDDGANAKVLLSKVNNQERYKMEITIRAKNIFVRSEVESDNMYANLDTCLAKIERQIVRISGKAKEFKNVEVNDLLFFDELPETKVGEVVKRKEFELDPITEEEAINRLELLDNDFYVYRDAHSGNVHVLYRREDGNYGLIVTR